MAAGHMEILRSVEQLLAIGEAWDALWRQSDGAYHLSFASCLESWKTIHQPLGRSLQCAILREEERLVAILPMVGFRRKGLWKVAQSLGPEAAEGCDILVARDAPHRTGTALFEYFIAAARPDIIDLPYVVSNGVLDVAIRSSGTFQRISQVEQMPYAVLRGEQNWTSFERTVSRSYQQQTRRKLRRLEEQGAVEFTVIKGAADASIDWLLDEKKKWGAKVGKLGPWLFSPQYRAYLKGLARSSPCVLTFVLKLDGVPSAVKVIFAAPTLCTLIIAAYDETQSYYSPGNILDEFWVSHVFDTCADDAGRKLDINFGVGSERYKMHWARGHTVETRTYKVAPSAWGQLPYRVKAAAEQVKRLRRQPHHARPLDREA